MLARSMLVKVVVLGFLVAMLAIPLLAIWVLTGERAGRRKEVAREVTASWGGAQLVAGPVLSVPYETITRTEDGKERRSRDVVRVLPASLDIAGRTDVEVRRRAIYRVPVYTTHLKITGTFRPPDPQALGLAAEAAPVWDRATVSLGGFDLKAVRPEFAMTLDGQPVAGEPDSDTGLWPTGIAAPAARLATAPPGRDVPFEIMLPIRGSDSLAFLPAGRTTAASLTSTWPSPGFVGSLLPEDRTVTAAGFTARWRASYLGRNVPQSWRESDLPQQSARERLERSRFGVTLVTPVDIYRETERSTKYAVLFVILTFLTFFIVEVLQPANVHPVQYLLVGAALCIFYLLLLSLAEQIGFTPAYLVASVATVVLVATYSRHAFGARRSAIRVGLVLAGLYAFLYVLLRLEDYALMIGSLVLFAVLAGVMFLTRKVDWYTIGSVLTGSSSDRQGRG